MAFPRVLLSLVFICCFCSIFGQSKTKQNELVLSLLRTEPLLEAVNDFYMFQWVHGMSYKRRISNNFSILAGIEYINRKINEKCASCMYSFLGQGKFKEVRGNIGLRFQWTNTSKWTPYIDELIFIAKSNYIGAFASSQGLNSIEVDNEYAKAGAYTKLGVHYSFQPRIHMGVASAIRLQILSEESKSDFRTQTTDREAFWMPLELWVGYAF